MTSIAKCVASTRYFVTQYQYDTSKYFETSIPSGPISCVGKQYDAHGKIAINSHTVDALFNAIVPY